MERGDPGEPRSEPSGLAATGRQQRRRLAALLADPRLGGPRLLARLREFRSLEGVAACSAAVDLLARLSLPEPRAEELLAAVIERRAELARLLGRDPGLAVAMADHLIHVDPLLREPVIVETSYLDHSERVAWKDPLTDLFERQYFERRMAVEIRRSRRTGAELSVVAFDLDSFRPVNDVYGHALGDRVLRMAGRLVHRATRDSDLVSRTGGDEFTAILPSTSRLGAFATAERARQRLASEFAAHPVDGRLVAMTVSAGVASFPADGETSEALLASAGQALKRAKVRGGNAVVMHHAEKRRAVRWPARGAVEASFAARHGGARHAARPLDLSECGALLETVASCERSQPVTLTLADRDALRSIPAWVVRVEAPTDGSPRRVALAFERPIPAGLLAPDMRRRPPGSRRGEA